MELKLDKRFIDEAVQEAVKDIKQNYIKKDVLNKIKTEIKALTNGETPERIWNVDVFEIIDKYKQEREEEE